MPRTSSASSGSQAVRRKRGDPEPEEDEDVNATSEEEVAKTQSGGGPSEDELRKQSAKLIRFAFAMERNKRALRRGETGNIIPNSRHFPAILERAQSTLRKTFGMELVELKPKFKVGDDLEAEQAQAAQATQATQAAQAKKGKGKGKSRRMQDIEEEDEDDDESEEEMPKAKKKAKPTTTGFFVLRSTLPPALLEQMANPKPFPITAPTQANAPADVNPDHGALIDWEGGDSTQTGHIAMLGIRTIILCLIMANNRMMSDDQLHGFLRRLGIERDTPLPYKLNTSANTTVLTLDKFLDLLDRQLYLQKIRVPTPGSAETHSIQWRWGQRQAEFSEPAAAKFIEEIMFQGRDEVEEVPRPAARGKRAAAPADGVASIADQKKRMRRDLERAVGGPLQGEV